MKERSLLISATRLVYSIGGLPDETRLYWSELIRYLFHQQLNLPEIKATEIAAALRPFTTTADAVAYFKSLERADQVSVACYLQLVSYFADQTSDLQSKKELTAFTAALLAGSELPQNEITRSSDELLNGFAEFKKRKKILVPGSIRLFCADYVLRWVVLMAGIHYLDEGWVVAFNVCLVPAVIVALAAYFSNKDKTYNKVRLLAHRVNSHSRLRYVYTTGQYTLLAVFVATGATIPYLLFDTASALTVSFVALVSYFILILATFPLGRLDENFLEDQRIKKSSAEYKDADENDERIVLLETQLNSSTGRLEAYVLESALFGALAFSAFLQIFATNLISFGDVEKFASGVHRLAHGLITGNGKEFYRNLAALSNKESLFSLISIETLICSGLFVAVIASRLRFSHVADKLRTDLNLAKAFNEKEEKILESEDPEIRASERFLKINQRVHDYLESASQKLIDISPIVNYIVYFRNLGVLMFAGVLVTSCLFISNALAWGFLVVAAATWAYFNAKAIRVWASSLDLRATIYFAKHRTRLLLLSFMPLVLAFVFKIGFGIEESDYLVTLTILLVAIYFAAAAIQPYYDAKFGDIETGSRWNTVKILYGFSIIISGVAIAMKTNRLLFSNEMILIGFSLISLLNYALSFYLTKSKWLALLMGLALSTGVIGLLFKTMHWNGANLMLIVALPFWLFFVAAYLIWRNQFHKFFVKIALVYGIGFLLINYHYVVFELRYSPIGYITSAYQNETFNLAPLRETKNQLLFKEETEDENWDRVSEREIKRSINVLETYAKQHGTRHGYTEIYKTAFDYYGDFGEAITMNPKKPADSAALAKVYLVVVEARKIAKMFGYKHAPLYRVTQAVLLQLGKKDQLLNYYNEILALTPLDDFKDLVTSDRAVLLKGEKTPN
jgi:hypothetical protein